ncbi:MAG TPA: lipoprotein [Casimicrobiaceae bacterium]
MMLREFAPAARRLAVALVACALVAGCGIKGPLKAPPGAKAPPPPPPGVELPSTSDRSD